MNATFFRRALPGLVLGALLFAVGGRAMAQVDKRIKALELDGGTGWIGTDENLTLKGLKGKIVVFDFWTLC